LKNYWGYQPVSFFAPHSGYSQRKDPLGPVDEFRQLVKALHRAGLEVILDVVFNHTAEGGADGPTISFAGSITTLITFSSRIARAMQTTRAPATL
jgi:glycogen operon protein